MTVDEGLADQTPGRINDLARLCRDPGFDGGDLSVGNGDVGLSAIGQQSALHDQVEGHVWRS